MPRRIPADWLGMRQLYSPFATPMTISSDSQLQAILEQYTTYQAPPVAEQTTNNARNEPTLKNAVEDMTHEFFGTAGVVDTAKEALTEAADGLKAAFQAVAPSMNHR
jgi:hypothetical protein